jgi:hypothetical protein
MAAFSTFLRFLKWKMDGKWKMENAHRMGHRQAWYSADFWRKATVSRSASVISFTYYVGSVGTLRPPIKKRA